MTWAVVTGASGGLGRAYARYLASCGLSVVLTGRRDAELRALASELTSKWGTTTLVRRYDLAEASDRAALLGDLDGLDVDTLVNNAGFGMLGPVRDADAARLSSMVTLNCVALTELTRAVLPGMVERGSGSIVNVASTAAFQPIPTMAAYAASKAYVLRFTEALWAEVSGTGVRAVAICPGPTDTAFFEAAGNDSVMKKRRTPEQVVQATFAALRANRPAVVDGPANALLAATARFVPTRLGLRIARFVVSQG
ncbi:MAG: SDR family oxidoreductase [Propionibacteriaceae bacterium]|nr:SDR family oxidoreductase [Propionibacteriaceae bacterium]